MFSVMVTVGLIILIDGPVERAARALVLCCPAIGQTSVLVSASGPDVFARVSGRFFFSSVPLNLRPALRCAPPCKSVPVAWSLECECPTLTWWRGGGVVDVESAQELVTGEELCKKNWKLSLGTI